MDPRAVEDATPLLFETRVFEDGKTT